MCDSAHYTEFCNDFSNGDVDIIGVSETFYRETSLIRLENYSVINVNRKDRNGGGVAIYVRKGLQSKVLSTSKGEAGKPEYIICEILVGSTKILFACVYRPPHVGYMDIFQDDICNYITQYKYTFICGDLNARFGTDDDEYEAKIVSDILTSCNLTPIPYEATYHTGHSHSILDIIASNCSDLVLDYGQTTAPGFSAHDLIYAVFNLNVPRFQRRTVTYRDYKSLEEPVLIEYANTLPWDEMYLTHDINNKLCLFNKLMLQVFERCIPIKTALL